MRSMRSMLIAQQKCDKGPPFRLPKRSYKAPPMPFDVPRPDNQPTISHVHQTPPARVARCHPTQREQRMLGHHDEVGIGAQ